MDVDPFLPYKGQCCDSDVIVAQSCPDSVTPWTVAYQALPSMGFSRQEYWSGVP